MTLIVSFEFCLDPSETPKKKRKSRWANDDGKIAISGLPTALPANMSEEDQKLYICECPRQQLPVYLVTAHVVGVSVCSALEN